MSRFLLLLALLPLLSTAGAGISVRDDLGSEVHLARPATRIVTLSPHATELLLALGLDERLVAVAGFSGYPKRIAKVPRLPALGPLDRERILALQPDLVVAWASGNHPADLRWLEKAGIAVYRSEPEKLETIADSLEKLGILTGDAAAGHQAATRFRRALENACLNRAMAPRQRVFLQIWPTPPLTVGGRHWLNEVLQRARLTNIYGDQPRGMMAISRESLMSRNPQLVLLTAPTTPLLPNRPSLLLDATLGRPGPKLVKGLRQLCRNLPTKSSAHADRQAAGKKRYSNRRR